MINISRFFRCDTLSARSEIREYSTRSINLSLNEERLNRLEENAAIHMSERDKYRDLVNKKKEERDRLNGEIRGLRSLAVSEKEKRDEINARVAEIKSEVNGLRDQLDEKNEQLNKIHSEREVERRRLPNKKRLSQEIQQIEWTLSTTPTLEIKDREGELIDRARELRSILKEHEKIKSDDNKIIHSMADKRAVEMMIRERRNEMQQLHNLSQEHHERMLQYYKKIEEERKRADDAHSKFIENITLMKEVNSTIDFVMVEIRKLRKELKMEDNFRVTNRDKVIVSMKRELAEVARKKLQSGEKLSLEEMKLIYGES